MASINWQLQTPAEAVVFDCDGTLSTIEGIDELARNKGVSATVAKLTEEAMGLSGITPELYEQRLALILPHAEEINTLGERYFQHMTPDANHVIQMLQRLKKSVYILSAGLTPAVRIFGKLLQIASENISAVDISFDANGRYLDFDRHSPLVKNNGKRSFILQLLKKYNSIIYVGDGLNDLIVTDLVTRFIGFGGAFYRHNIAAQCQFYIKSPSLLPILPLCLTADEAERLLATDKKIYRDALSIINAGQVEIKKKQNQSHENE